MDLLKQSIEQVKVVLLELEKLFNDGKDRNDAKVKDMEHKICTFLDVPKESWMNSNQTLKDVIESLHKKLDTVQNATIPHEMIPDRDVLKNASGGLALEGVYKTRNLEDLLVNREQLIEIPESFSLTNSKQRNIYEQIEFTSHKSEKAFHRGMEKMGPSSRGSFNIGCKCFGFGLVDGKNESNERGETSSNSQEESYILQTKYNYIPLACGVFQMEELRLSNAALQALKQLEMTSLHSNYKSQTSQVRLFFERFGSHVNQGPVHFGGIFWWRSSASGFRSNDLTEVKRLTLDSLNVCCGGGLGYGVLTCAGGKVGIGSFQLKGSGTGKYREDLMTQVHLSVSKTGGPPEIDDHFLWKSCLASNNKTWSVIDRGTSLIPVWEIVMTSHRHDFNDVSKLSNILIDAYKEITGEHVEEVWRDNILMDKAEALIQSVKTWSATNCESHLTHLLDFKTRLCKETGSNVIWLQKCLSNKILQNYLFKVVSVNSESIGIHMRCLMRALLEPDLYTIENFENRSEIVRWANETEVDPNESVSVSNFSELDSILQCIKKQMEDNRHAFSCLEQDYTAKKEATTTVTLALNSLCRTLGENYQEEAKLLIISIIAVFGYSSENKTFNHLLDVNEIALLQSELHDAFSRYSSLREQCPIRAQAYLLLTALTISTDKVKKVSSADKAERLGIILRELKELSNPIKSVVEKMQDDWESLEKALDSIKLDGQEDTGSWERREECQKENGVKTVAPLSELYKADEHNSPFSETEEDPNQYASVSEFTELDSILQRLKKEMEDNSHVCSSPEQDYTAKLKVTKTVTLALNSLCKTLGECDQEEAKLLIKSIITVFGYSSENKTFNHPLDVNEIALLQSELHDAFSRYSSLREQCPIRAQAYLLLTALTISTDKVKKVSSADKAERLGIILRELKELSNPIKSVVEEMENDWESLEKALDSITMDGKQDTGNREKRENELGCQMKNEVKSVAPLPELHETDEHNSPLNEKDEKGKTFMDLLQKLGLQDHYPKKMTKASVLEINRQSVEEPKTERDLCSHYLYKLMMLDYRGRYVFVKVEDTSIVSEQSSANDDEEEEEEEDEEDEQKQIHPMDVLMAIFHCSDDFLRQFIFTKLSICQFSLPFLVPNPCKDEVEFPLWALRHIQKSWHSKTQTESGSSGNYHNRQIFNTAVPVVSFIRLGDSDFNSKSQILNGVINGQKHSVFFHRHCKGSTPDSLLMNGVVEIAWYCPGGKTDDRFDDCVAFLNLHGDAAEHLKQLEFLQAVSTVSVLLISENTMIERAEQIHKKLSESPVPLISLLSGTKKVKKSKNLKKPDKVELAAKNRNQAEFIDELISSIKECISKYKQTSSIESCCEEARKQQFIVDEDKQSCKDGHDEAQKLVNHLKNVKLLNLKETILPLQGLLWHDWCKKNKEQYRLQNKEKISIEKQLSDISVEMKNIRLRQLNQTKSLGDFMSSFLDCLTEAVLSASVQFEDTHLYMLQWLRILLDHLTSDELVKLEGNYHSKWRKMKTEQKDKDKVSSVCEIRKELDSIADQMAATTLGLQLVMREIGQLYEAIEHCLENDPRMTDRNKQLYAKLPQVGASMLISGYPLELMDGDAAHVPLVWIKAVLDQLIKSLGDRKVFVLSILGLQSSGKSTLLNTMFGLQFAVSAGRCTRGAFMQLLEVDTSIREELGYDFVLIVDTEGLRSLELSTKISVNHDNELATFIIGIGDVTVVNIMGENPSEMQDILQICVQAFLRMKKVNITPSCIFVHQNVADDSAKDKNAEGRRRLVEKLDEMAKVAAKGEDDDTITCFNDVIQFDIDTQAFYFKNLLEGDPPMAPPNPSYSQNVLELKTKLLEVGQWKDKCQFSSLSEFRSRVSDLWMALLQENFVFSFKNTTEMMQYNCLENEYDRWSWELRKHSLDLQTELQKKIGSNLIEKVVFADIQNDFDKIYIPLQKDINKFFSDDKNKEILINWKESITRRFSNLNSELIEVTCRKCKDLLNAKQMRSDLDQKKKIYTDQLTKQSKHLASKLKTETPTEEKITAEFDELWKNWTTEVSESLPPKKPLDVKAEVETVLRNKFYKERNILHRVQTDVLQNFEGFMHGTDVKNAKVIKQATETVNKYFTSKDNEKKKVDDLIDEMLSCVEKDISAFASGYPKLSTEFQVDLLVYLCFMNVSRLQGHENKPYFQSIIKYWNKLFPSKGEPQNVKHVMEAVLLQRFQNIPDIQHKVQMGMILSLDTSAQGLLSRATHTVNKCIDAHENDKKDFDQNLIYEILSGIEKDFADNEIEGHSKISNEFKVDLSVRLCLKNVSRLQKMHEEFQKSNHPLTYLQSQRETYFQSFKHYCEGASSVTIFVDFLCKNIKPEILNTAHDKTCQEIADSLKNNDPALNGARSKLENHILRDLAIQENISRYQEYVHCPKKYFERFIKERVQTFCLNRKQQLYQNNLDSLRKQLLTASTNVTAAVVGKKGNASMWLDLFCEEVGSLIVIRKADLRSIENEEIRDWEFLKTEIANSLEEMLKDEKIDPNTLIEKPTSILFEQLQGCWAQCPFCGAICTNTIPNHDIDHSVRFHRSGALRGRHWHETDHFAIEFCTTSVASDDRFRRPKTDDEWIPFRDYRTAGDPYDKWSITADGSSQRYWKWFLCTFRSQWEEKYGYKFTGRGEIPAEWEKIKKDDVLKELQDAENIHSEKRD